MLLKIASVEAIFGDHRKTRLGRPRHRVALEHRRLEECLVPGLERLRVGAGCRVLPDRLHGVVQRLGECERQLLAPERFQLGGPVERGQRERGRATERDFEFAGRGDQLRARCRGRVPLRRTGEGVGGPLRRDAWIRAVWRHDTTNRTGFGGG